MYIHTQIYIYNLVDIYREIYISVYLFNFFQYLFQIKGIHVQVSDLGILHDVEVCGLNE